MKRVLAIDGGGLRGAVPASFLAELEERIGDRVAGYFDLIAGTSTGGLIALGLGLGFPARHILQLYEEWGPRIFARRKLRLLPTGLLSPMYDLDVLRQAVEEAFGRAKLGETRCRLLVPAYDAASGKVRLWRAYHGGGPVDDVSAVDVALSTSAAPVYFGAHRTPEGTPFLDGGVYANCPVLVAVIDAAAMLGWDPREVRVLSLGCSIAPFRAGQVEGGAAGGAGVAGSGLRRGAAGSGSAGLPRILRGGMLHWAMRLPELFLTAQEDASLTMARALCGPESIVRINPLDPGGNAVDNPADLPRFRALGAEAAARELPELAELFFRAKAEDPRAMDGRSAGAGHEVDG